ncbi:hypothetical protein RB653_005225 [Dictyostelium firmibasis]|uniref:Mitochondrial import inner membrane translocase subunit Tim21 n=1 Tax=Dictyostelium firmibasis TaxID=79012 RepID=A0AAN7Z0V5_9MYCE
MNNKILKIITPNIPKQIILNRNNSNILNKPLFSNKCLNNQNKIFIENNDSAKIINTKSKTILLNNNNNNNNNTIRNYSGRNYPYRNNDDNNSRLNILPSSNNQDSIFERVALSLVAFASVGLLIYVFYDGADEMIINNLVFKKTVDTLRLNEKVVEVFGEDFTAKGLGFRSNGSFTYKHSFDKNGDSIVLITFMIESARGKIGIVECKTLRNGAFGLEIKILKVKYENYKTITIVDEVLPKKFNNKLKNFLSIFGINRGNNSSSGGNNNNNGQ